MKQIMTVKFTYRCILLCLAALLVLPYIHVKAEEIDALAYESSYDGRDSGIITEVKDQGVSSLCWAYAAISASEASILKLKVAPNLTKDTLSLSPLQVGYARHNRGADPLGNTVGESTGKNWSAATGNISYVPSLFSQWCGPTSSAVSEDCNGWENAEFILDKAISLDGSQLSSDANARLAVKNAIVKYGAVTFSYNNLRDSYYYNPSNETGGASYPHACTIIGWDDDIFADSFIPGGATQNGGWLIKNSYTDAPYFYLSYDNNSTNNVYAFSFYEREAYDYNYFYDSDVEDSGVGAILKPRRVANAFKAKKGETKRGEYVTGVNVGIEGKNTRLTVKVYHNLEDAEDPLSGDLAATEEMTAEHAGFYTLKLSKPVLIEEGSMFSVVAEISEGENSYFKVTQNQGTSFRNQTGSWAPWGYAPRIKAYTKLIDEKIYFTDESVFLKTDEGDNGVFILCCYEGNRLKGLNFFDVSESDDYSFKIPAEWTKAAGKKLKGILWKSFSDMKPILSKEAAWS